MTGNSHDSKGSEVDPEVLAKCRGFEEYVEAKLGFRNHWYPTLFSDELAEGEFKSHSILGDQLLMTRVEGKVLAVRDRCLHRGVAFSKKPECYMKGTITCWYHAFTYSMEDGKLQDILTNPSSKLIGKVGIRTFKVEEVKGIIFVFMGEIDPPDLSEDVPPGFLEESLAVRGVRQQVASNWRVGCENGFDSTHVFIHKDSILLEGNDITLPLGFVPKSNDTFRVEDKAGAPKGVFDLLAQHCEPVFEGKIGGKTVLKGRIGSKMVAHDISIWLPGVLCVSPFPDPSLTQFEWYVAIDETRHFYFQILARTIENDDEVDAFNQEFDEKWKSLALVGFNDDDVWARVAQQEFYQDDRAWHLECLFEPDENIREWRRLASSHNRGIQRHENILEGARILARSE